jgi:hypothetical protein
MVEETAEAIEGGSGGRGGTVASALKVALISAAAAIIGRPLPSRAFITPGGLIMRVRMRSFASSLYKLQLAYWL